MKSLLAIVFTLFAFTASAQDKPKAAAKEKMQTVEASCGTCKFGMAGDDCELAVRIDGKAYLVDGTSIDKHGDAHAKNGFCNAIRKAKVKGRVVDNKFVVSYFKLIYMPEKKG